MQTLTIIAHIYAKSDQVQWVQSQLIKLIDLTRAEEGCLQYDLHQDNEKPAHFLFFERWVSRELWQQHMKSQHVCDYVKATEHAVDHFTLNEMTSVAVHE